MTGTRTPRPLGCKAVRRRLPLFVGGDLGPGEQTAVEVHLGQCLECYRDARLHREGLVLLHGLAGAGPVMPREEDFAVDVMGRIDGPPPTHAAWISRSVTYGGWAAALVLGGFLWLYAPGASRGGSGPLPAHEPAPPPAAPAGFTQAPDDGTEGLEGDADAVVRAESPDLFERYLLVRDY